MTVNYGLIVGLNIVDHTASGYRKFDLVNFKIFNFNLFQLFYREVNDGAMLGVIFLGLSVFITREPEKE